MTQNHTPEMTQAISRLTITDIFFTALLYSLKLEMRPDDHPIWRGHSPTMATDSVRLYYSATFAAALTTAERTSVLVHELLHVILYHPLRRGIRHPLLWNIACDYVVNLLLVEYGYAMPTGKFAGIPADRRFAGMSAEQVYDVLLKEQPSQGDGSGDGEPGENIPGADSMMQDIRDYLAGENEGKPASQVEREIGIATEKALQSAKASGQSSSRMKGVLEDAQVQREPWFSHLRRYITTLNARAYNWARIDTRRAVSLGIIAPQMRTEQMGQILVSIDESGSLTDPQLSAIGAHLSDICRDCRPKSVVVIRHTDEVTHVEEFEGPDYRMVLERKSTGGTDFRPVFDLIATDYSGAQVVLMMTDMYGPMGDVPPPCDVLWVTSSRDVQAPFGEIIGADFND